MCKVAHNIVRMAQDTEGLESWLNRHSGSINAPSLATRRYALEVYGDSMEASLFNAYMILEVDKYTKAA